MTKRSHSEIEQLDRIRVWIREERNIRGWSAKRLAAEAREAAQRRGITSNLKQQSISALELGNNKSIPAWLNLLTAAFEDNPPPAAIQQANSLDLSSKLPEKICSKKIPPEHDLRKIFLGLLATMDVSNSDSWLSKQQIAASLAKRFPLAMSQPQTFIDI